MSATIDKAEDITVPACQRCSSKRVLSISAKSGELFQAFMVGANEGDPEIKGYIPEGLGIGYEKYVEFDYCLECGQIQGEFPLSPIELEKA